MSVSCDFIVRYHSPCKIFNPFEINEDDSYKLEYQYTRSIPVNISSLLFDLKNLDHGFSVIKLTETWLNSSKIDAHNKYGYTHVGIARSNQHGGGVSLFMSNEISSYSKLTEFTKVQEYIACLFQKFNFRDITSI